MPTARRRPAKTDAASRRRSRASGVNPPSQPCSGAWRSTKSSASTRDPSSSPALARMRSTISGASGWSAASWRAMRRASAASSRRSGRPIAQRGPASSRMSADPALGSLSTRSAETTSTTSGVDSSPPRPRMRCGMPRRPSASPKRTMCFLLRNRIAPVVGVARAARSSRTRSNHSATRSASASRSASNDEFDLSRRRTRPRAQLVDRHRGGCRERRQHRVRGAQAPVRCCASWSSARTARIRLPGENASANPPRLPALAPRQP